MLLPFIPRPWWAIAVALALFAAAPPHLRAQAPDLVEDLRGGYFQVGYLVLDLDALNATLTGSGYPGPRESSVTIGGGGFGMKGPVLLGGEGHALIGARETTADGSTRVGVGGGYGLFRVGYRAYGAGVVDVFPMIGVGGGGMNLSLVDRSAPTFDDVLADPRRSADLSSGAFLLDASLAVFVRPNLSGGRPAADERDDDGPGGLLLGLHAGYTFQPHGSSWRLDTINDVAGGPDLKLQGFYVRLSIGGWGGR